MYVHEVDQRGLVLAEIGFVSFLGIYFNVCDVRIKSSESIIGQ